MNETRTHGTPTRSGERRRERGFTLVELLVVIAIIANNKGTRQQPRYM